MSRFRKSERREVPTLNTSSLPDLIFTILFFFIIVTHIRPVSELTQLELPTATEIQRLEEKSLVVYIMVGKKQENQVSTPIQLNSELVSIEEMPAALEKLGQKTSPEEESQRLVVMKIDKETPMGLVNDIKKILRESNWLTIHYSVDKNRNSL